MTRHYRDDAEALEAIRIDIPEDFNIATYEAKTDEQRAALNRAIDRARSESALAEAARKVVDAGTPAAICSQDLEDAVTALRTALEAAEPPEET